MKKLLLVSSIAAALAAPMFAHAESKTNLAVVTGSTASAKLDFTIVIPPVLYIRIGTGNAVAAADNTTVDKITFTVPALGLGDSTIPTAGTGGDLTAGAVTVRVFSNFGTGVNLNATALGKLTSSGLDTIDWTEIGITSTALPAAQATANYTNGSLAHPVLTAAGVGTAVPIAVVAKLVRQETKWTFSYKNTTTPVAGSYGAGTGTNGQLTYTVTQL